MVSRKLSKAIRRAVSKAPSIESVWRGPLDGITQSMLSEFLICRERFRIRVVDGLRVKEGFSHALEFGNYWHLCEESLGIGGPNGSGDRPWEPRLEGYVKSLCRRYPLQQEQIVHWMNICLVQFPIYLDYWAKHADEEVKSPIMSEQVFRVPYCLPSGRVVALRGKWDGVNSLGSSKDSPVYLQENKTKGEINEEAMRMRLSFDLQTMFYLVALKMGGKEYGIDPTQVQGVHYNVVRRPLSGGRHSIRQRQPTKTNPSGESFQEFYARLAEEIASEPAYFFMRWRAEIDSSDVYQFRRRFLDPILEQLCDWWEWICSHESPFEMPKKGDKSSPHWITPYGLWNPMANNRGTEIDEYLRTGSTLGLEKVKTLFGELEDA